MAAYPTYTQHVSSRARRRGNTELDRAANDTIRGRSFAPSNKYDFETVHPAMTLADHDALLAFFDANELLQVDFYSDQTGLTHSVLFDGPPEFTPLGASLFRALVKMREV